MLSLRLARWLPAAVLLLASSVPARGSEPVPPAHSPTAEQVRFFEESVRPILAERCFSCHGESKQRGDLRVDSLGALLAGGESGPALDLENPGRVCWSKRSATNRTKCRPAANCRMKKSPC
jgi:hypothetical protein